LNRRKLENIERELLALRRSPQGVKASDLTSLAGKLGRSRVNRGKEPTYERAALLPDLPAYPLTIPGHPGDLRVGTVKSIVNDLLNDVDEWKQWLELNDPST
jgi:hypothetical protein